MCEDFLFDRPQRMFYPTSLFGHPRERFIQPNNECFHGHSMMTRPAVARLLISLICEAKFIFCTSVRVDRIWDVLVGSGCLETRISMLSCTFMRIDVGRGALIAHNLELSAPAHTTVRRCLKVVAQTSHSHPHTTHAGMLPND